MNSGKWLLALLCAAIIGVGAADAYAQNKPLYSKSKPGTTVFTPKKLSEAEHLQVKPEQNFEKRMAMVKAQNAINSDLAAQERKRVVADKIQRMMNERTQYLQEQRAAANAVAQGKGTATAKTVSKTTPVYNTVKKKPAENFKIFNFGKKD